MRKGEIRLAMSSANAKKAWADCVEAREMHAKTWSLDNGNTNLARTDLQRARAHRCGSTYSMRKSIAKYRVGRT